MYPLIAPFSFWEVFLFLIALVAFVLTIRFFIASQRNLRQLMPHKSRRGFGFQIDRSGFILPVTGKAQQPAEPPKTVRVSDETRTEMAELREMLQQQQAELSRALRQIEGLNELKEENWDRPTASWEDESHSDETAQETIAELQRQLQHREQELEEREKESGLSQNLQTHFEEVQASYELLQAKVEKMEQQAWQAADLAMRVDSLEQANEQLEKTLLRREEKLRELGLENGKLHELLSQTEDKLTQANLQRQQLIKKTQFLEEINNDIQQMSDANRKLKTELRRVGELESMLNLITEERDVLLRRRLERK